MAAHNSDIASIFDRIADFLDIKGENPFRVRAYRNASLVVGSLAGNVAEMVKNGEDLSQLPGIGKELAAKIEEIVKTGRLAFLERLEKETPPGLVKMLVILVTCDDSSSVMSHFIKYEDVGKVVAHGEARSTAMFRSGFQADVRVVPEKSYGAALCYFTGSQTHNIELRRIAKNRHFKLNEYGVFRAGKSKKDEWLAGRTEEEVYEKLDLEDDVLKELDYTVCAVHYKFNLSIEKQTERIIRAMDNPYFNILAHSTGRLIHERDPYEVDMDRIISAAKERRCVLELNAHPMRLDLNDTHCKLAKESGAKIAISTDSHNMGDLDYMRFGINQARRGWLEPEDVINTRSLPELKKALKRS